MGATAAEVNIIVTATKHQSSRTPLTCTHRRGSPGAVADHSTPRVPMQQSDEHEHAGVAADLCFHDITHVPQDCTPLVR